MASQSCFHALNYGWVVKNDHLLGHVMIKVYITIIKRDLPMAILYIPIFIFFFCNGKTSIPVIIILFKELISKKFCLFLCIVICFKL